MQEIKKSHSKIKHSNKMAHSELRNISHIQDKKIDMVVKEQNDFHTIVIRFQVRSSTVGIRKINAKIAFFSLSEASPNWISFQT